MFRILENVDGTTSIFCKNSGNLLCTVPCKANSNTHQRINVVGPQPCPKWQHSNAQYSSDDDSTELYDGEMDTTPPTRNSRCCLSPIPIPISPDGDQTEDYSGECISEESFAKCLGLVPKSLLASTPREKLLAEWPLRLIARSKAYRTAEIPAKEIKIHDVLPLTSYMGMRILKMNKGRMFVTAERIRALMRSYESYCRHPWNTSSSNVCHFPKLRCREKKNEYPVVVPVRVLKHLHNHTYTRGRRQRWEREVTRRTGLDARSRHLFRKCKSRTLRVNVTRLPESEIYDWLSRRDPIYEDSESEEEHYDPSYRPSKRTMAVHRPRQETKSLPSCSVYVRNVVMDIQRHSETHYVKDTDIEVPFFKDFLSSLRTNLSLLQAAYETRIKPKSGAEEEVHISETRNVCRTLPTRGIQKSKPTLCSKGGDTKDAGKSTLNRSLPSRRNRKQCVKENSSRGWQQTPPTRTPQGTKQRTKKFKPLEVNLTAESNKKPLVFIPDFSGYKDYSPPVRICPKKTTPQTLSAMQNSSKHKASIVATGSGQKTEKPPTVFIHGSSGFRELRPSIEINEVLQKRSPPKPNGTFPRSSVSNECANSSGQKTEKHVVSNDGKHPGALAISKKGPSMKARKTCAKKSTPLVLHTDSAAFKKLVQSSGTSEEKISSDSDESIPLIDLTEEPSPPPKRPQEKSGGNRMCGRKPKPLFPVHNQEERFRVYRWTFSCFACDYRRRFFNGEQQQFVDKIVRDHLHLYHNASEADSFVSRYLDSVTQCMVIEAFPGFKTNNN